MRASMKIAPLLLLAALGVVSCKDNNVPTPKADEASTAMGGSLSGVGAEKDTESSGAGGSVATQNESRSLTLTPPAPGEPGGLPDDRTPVAEGPIKPDSPQGAAAVVERYARALESGKFDEAMTYWGEKGTATGMPTGEFLKTYKGYREIHALIGGPGKPEGAVGSTYVDVPLQLYGRDGTGKTFNLIGPITLKRVNNVPGASPASLRWHISKSDLKPLGTVKEAPAG